MERRRRQKERKKQEQERRRVAAEAAANKRRGPFAFLNAATLIKVAAKPEALGALIFFLLAFLFALSTHA